MSKKMNFNKIWRPSRWWYWFGRILRQYSPSAHYERNPGSSSWGKGMASSVLIRWSWTPTSCPGWTWCPSFAMLAREKVLTWVPFIVFRLVHPLWKKSEFNLNQIISNTKVLGCNITSTDFPSTRYVNQNISNVLLVISWNGPRRAVKSIVTLFSTYYVLKEFYKWKSFVVNVAWTTKTCEPGKSWMIFYPLKRRDFAFAYFVFHPTQS